jgi:hypothetical protein
MMAANAVPPTSEFGLKSGCWRKSCAQAYLPALAISIGRSALNKYLISLIILKVLTIYDPIV